MVYPIGNTHVIQIVFILFQCENNTNIEYTVHLWNLKLVLNLIIIL